MRYDLSVKWKCFPLEQVNSKEANFRLWEQPDNYESKSLLAFRAFQTALYLGSSSWGDFHMSLLKLKHEEKRELGEMETILQAAGNAGLHLEKFKSELLSPWLKAKIGEDYTEGITKYGVFGVPTIVFENGQTAFIKLDSIPEGDEAVDLFETILHLMGRHPCVKEIKKPTPPL